MGLLLSVLVTCVGVLELIALYTDFFSYSEYRTNLRDIAKRYAIQLQKYPYLYEPDDKHNGAELLYTPALRTNRSKSPSPFGQSNSKQQAATTNGAAHFTQDAIAQEPLCQKTTRESHPINPNIDNKEVSEQFMQQFVETLESHVPLDCQKEVCEEVIGKKFIRPLGNKVATEGLDVTNIEDVDIEIRNQNIMVSDRSLQTQVKESFLDPNLVSRSRSPSPFAIRHFREPEFDQATRKDTLTVKTVDSESKVAKPQSNRSRSPSPFSIKHFKDSDLPDKKEIFTPEIKSIESSNLSTPDSCDYSDMPSLQTIEKQVSTTENISEDENTSIKDISIGDQLQEASEKKKKRRRRKKTVSEGELKEPTTEPEVDATKKTETNGKHKRRRHKTPVGDTPKSQEEEIVTQEEIVQPNLNLPTGRTSEVTKRTKKQSSQCPNRHFTLPPGEDPEQYLNEEYLRTLDGVKQSKTEDKRRSFRKKRNSSSSSRASREDLRSSFDEDDNKEDKRSSRSFTSVKESEETTENKTCSDDSKFDEDSLDSLSSAITFDVSAPQIVQVDTKTNETARDKFRQVKTSSFEEASGSQNVLMKRRLSREIPEKEPVFSQVPSDAFWLIFSAEYTNAMEKDWHGQHFSCWQCDESLTGQRYVLRDEHPYCVKCYEQVFANTCEKCNRIIGIDSKDLSYKEKHWHETCFQCTTCGDSLVDKQFGAKGEKIYCGRCYDNQFASRCDGCGNIFHAGTKKMEYKNRQWHESCFCCCTCKTPIGTKSFIPREKDIYCASCYEEKFATRCIKCNKAIQSGGVTYKNEPWHRECFTCTHCNKNLAGQRFTSRDDKPCCADCFGKLFAKRCTACNEPITGIGGTRFISFEDRHWHNDCFTCASCSESLVGRGFITDNDKIICPECAKQRFM